MGKKGKNWENRRKKEKGKKGGVHMYKAVAKQVEARTKMSLYFKKISPPCQESMGGGGQGGIRPYYSKFPEGRVILSPINKVLQMRASGSMHPQRPDYYKSPQA